MCTSYRLNMRENQYKWRYKSKNTMNNAGTINIDVDLSCQVKNNGNTGDWHLRLDDYKAFNLTHRRGFTNKSPLPLTDPRDLVRHAHCAVHRCGWSVW